MAGGSGALHESPEVLRPETVERHRAIVSLMEELEAIDWYDQRVDAARDQELRDVLAHNRDEEKEHAAMALEWLRRSDPTLSQHLKTFLFTHGPITGIEATMDNAGGDAEEGGPSDDGSLGIGSLRSAKPAAKPEGVK